MRCCSSVTCSSRTCASGRGDRVFAGFRVQESSAHPLPAVCAACLLRALSGACQWYLPLLCLAEQVSGEVCMIGHVQVHKTFLCTAPSTPGNVRYLLTVPLRAAKFRQQKTASGSSTLENCFLERTGADHETNSQLAPKCSTFSQFPLKTLNLREGDSACPACARWGRAR